MATVKGQQHRYLFQHLSSKDGFVSEAWSSLRGTRGFMWFGTSSGLYRYDGKKFKIYSYDPKDSTSISGNSIEAPLFEDSEGNLWVGTRANGLNRYNRETETFTRFRNNPEDPLSLCNNYVSCIFEDRQGVMWVGTHKGLNKYHPDKGTFTSYLQYPHTRNKNHDIIRKIYEDNKGILFVGTNDGLFSFDRDLEIFTLLENVSQIPQDFKNISFRDILEGKNGILWLGTNTGLIRYNSISGQFKRYHADAGDPNSLHDNDVQKIQMNFLEEDKTIWICTTGGLSKFNIENETFTGFTHDPSDPNSLSDDLSFNIYIDETGIMWIANESVGVDILNLNESPFKSYDLVIPPPVSKHVTAASFLYDDKGELWVGSSIYGLFRFNNEMELTDWYNFGPDQHKAYAINFIRFVYQDSKGDIWAGTGGGGLFVYDKENNRFRHFPIQKSDTPELLWVYRIFEDSQKTLWLAVNKGILFRDADSDSFTALSDVTNDPITNTRPYCVGEDSEGNIWIGSRETGLYQLTPENRRNMQFINYRHDSKNPKSINNDVVLSIYNDNNDDLWIGTNVGLNKFNPQDTSFAKYDVNSGLVSRKIQHIEEDNIGNLWLTTEKGLVSFNPAETILSRSKIYETQDGLPFSGIYPFYFYKNKEGKMFVGGRKSSYDGFFSFYPDSLINNLHVPPIVITDFKINNEAAKLDSSITEVEQIQLKYNQNFFSFEFAALDYTNPGKNQYSYKLEGYDAHWLHAGNRNFANYTGVPPGAYTFRVKGSNNDGLWNEEGASIRLFISPPFWKTWWAYAVYMILFVAVILGIRRYDLKRQQLKQALHLEHIQTEKLEELDRMKSQFFANISHEFRTPLTLILGPLKKVMMKTQDKELENDLGIMQRNASRLHNLINQLLSLSKLESGKMRLQAREENIVHLVNSYVQSFESLAKQRSIHLSFTSNVNNYFIYVDRNSIEKIINNLLSNAFKFTKEGDEIIVSVNSQTSAKGGKLLENTKLKCEFIHKDGVVIGVSDTGKGIPQERIEHVFDRFYQAHDDDEIDYEGTGIGLALTKELVELHSGRIWAESIPDSKTTFVFYLPFGKDHLKPEDLSEGISDETETDEVTATFDSEARQDDIPRSDIESEEDEKQDTGLPIVLIVEDNRDMRAYIRGYLEETYRIIEAENGETGLKIATDSIPDLIISDVMMPRMNGIEMCNRIKADQRTSHIPIIMLTAKAGSESKIEGLETGADAYLTKPFEAEELLVRIRKLIEQRKKLRERFGDKLETGLPSVESGISIMDQKFLEKAREVVEQNLGDSDFSVEIFGKEMAMSRVQLHRKLTALINQSASRFIRTIRLKRAAEMLAEQSANVSGVAYEVGFNNLSWFAKCFQEQYGISPSDFVNRRNI